MTSLPQLPPLSTPGTTIAIPTMNDDFGSESATTPAGVKRDLEVQPTSNRPSKKPRDNRLRECFIITPTESGGEKISCRHCPDYNKTLQKFNPTKAREHLTTQCPGVDDALRQILLSTTQAAKRVQNEADEVVNAVVASATTPRPRKYKGRYRNSPAYISFHTDDTSLDVTAPIENGEVILRLTFPTDNLKLSFHAEKNTEGAALCIDGFMNMRADASWTASMCSMTSEGTRAGPHCQWSLNPDANGSFEEGMTRVQKVAQVLKAMMML